MPIYEYACGQCEQEFEVLVRGEETIDCPSCGGHDLHRKLSVPSIGRAQSSSLPICEMPRGGGCGAAACQSRCQFE